MAGTYKSIFKPKHPKKYIGDASQISAEVIGKENSVTTVTLIVI